MCGVKAAPKGDKEGESDDVRYLGQVLTVQNRAQVHRNPTGDLVPFSPRTVLPRFVNPRIGSKLLRLSI
jgi:hypothetical protein